LPARDPSLLLPGLVTAAAVAAVFFSWRAPLNRGTPLLTPGLFASVYVRPALAASLGPLGTALSNAVVETAIGVWGMAGLSVLLLGWLGSATTRWRTRGLAEITLALSVVLALPMAYAFSVKAMDGVVSPYEFIQAAQGLAFLAGAVNVIALAALLARLTPRAPVWPAALAAA